MTRQIFISFVFGFTLDLNKVQIFFFILIEDNALWAYKHSSFNFYNNMIKWVLHSPFYR